MTREEILAAASSIVCGEREETYGSPENNFALIASLWETYITARCVNSYYTEVLIDPQDVAIMLALLKIARTATGVGAMDNFVDLAGYAACAGEIFSSYHKKIAGKEGSVFLTREEAEEVLRKEPQNDSH